MFKIESYVTPILLSYVDKYVKDFRPADAQVSLWGGGVVLHNLVLKTDVVQQEVPLPFTLVSGRIHELLIQVPWTKIMSEPIIVTIDTIECILNPRPATEQPKSETPSGATQVVEAPPGYMQALVRRIVSNIAIRIHHLIVKYVQDDIVLSLNVKHLSINSTGVNWEPAFADIDPSEPAIRRLVVLDDLTLCLDKTDSDGKIRFYQDPLLYRCGLEFRILAKLFSANTRRASSFDVQMRTTKLAWGVTSAQLVLLLRLLKEQVQVENETPSPTSVPKASPSGIGVPSMSKLATPKTVSHTATTPAMPAPMNTQFSQSTASEEPPRRESWSDWAWSWKSYPRASEKDEPTMPSCPTPFSFSAFLDEVSLIIKIMETEGNTRNRSRAILELSAAFAAVKCWICAPTSLRAKVGIRSLTLKSNGKCTCGHRDLNTMSDEPTLYLSSRLEDDETWKWPEDTSDLQDIETAEAAEEDTEKQKPTERNLKKESKIKYEKPEKERHLQQNEPETSSSQGQSPDSVEQNVDDPTLPDPSMSVEGNPSRLRNPVTNIHFYDLVEVPRKDSFDALDSHFWKKLAPLVFVQFVHDRSPPDLYTNPYENPPKDFEYSDWEEECDIRVCVKPMDLRVCMGLAHRLIFIKDIFGDIPPAPIEPVRVLTVEEIEALSQNLPQRRIHVEIVDFRINVHPWDHSTVEKPMKEPILLRIEMPKIQTVITAPLYPQRVCSAASQYPDDKGLLWRACRMHITVALNDIKISLCSSNGDNSKPCGRIDLRFVTHVLLCPEYFEKKNSVHFSYAVKISEANICGSAPRLHAAIQVILSLMREQTSLLLQRTALAKDALADENLVALDITAEDFDCSGFITKRSNTHILTLQSLRATVFQSLPDKELQQAWLFSGPDVGTGMPYVRLAFQWCNAPFPGSVDFLGLYTEATALAFDPLFVSWLSYKASGKAFSDLNPQMPLRVLSSTQTFFRSPITPTASSSGRGPTRSGTASAEIHHKTRSQDSNSELSEKKERKTPTPFASETSKPAQPWWMGDSLLKLHERLKKVLICVELGLTLVYVTTTPATAVGCETMRVAMEKHASKYEAVVIYGVGRWTLYTNTVSRHLWYNIKNDGPTYLTPDKAGKEIESFPWKMMLGDVSCCTLEATEARSVMADLATGLRSRLKATVTAKTRTVLELVSTNIVLSVVTKTLQHKIVLKKNETQHTKRLTEKDKQQAKLRYFTAGVDFKPTTCSEFMRGPVRRKKDTGTQSAPTEQKEESSEQITEQKAVSGPIVSLGFNMHADTPPVVFRMEYNQVNLISVSLHCITHIIELLKQNIDNMSQHIEIHEVPSERNLERSEIEEDVTTETASDDRLITIIYQRFHDNPIKTFFWFQWVISRTTFVITVNKVKLAVDIDDVSLSVDLLEHYNQLKIKIASTSIKYFELSDDGWVAGAFGGHVLDARESLDAQEDVHFLSVIITSAQISNLPQNWKEELHPKTLEQQIMSDKIWEVYAVLAPLKLVIVPETLNNIILIVDAMMPSTSCSTPANEEGIQSTFSMPYCYLSAGGLKVVVASQVENKNNEDTFILSIGKISVNPHPDNPICRQSASTTDSGWNSVSLEGRQYELTVRDISLETAEFIQLATEQENSETNNANENPAVKWSKTVVVPTLSPILHPLDIELLLAPALFISGSLVCGAAIEINLTSDCRFEINFNQISLAYSVYNAILSARQQLVSLTGTANKTECPYKMFLASSETNEHVGYHESLRASETTPIEGDNTKEGGVTLSCAADSGMETSTSRSTYKSSPLKNKVLFSERRSKIASEYLEIFVATGTIELSLYAINDGSSEIQALYKIMNTSDSQYGDQPDKDESDVMKTGEVAYLDFRRLTNIKSSLARQHPKCVPLLHAKFHQPNLYYWQRRSQKSLQVSLFNLWFGLGMGLMENLWHSPILSTASGSPDPDTDIPPSLATMKYISGTSGEESFLNQRGTINLDIERPVLIEARKQNVHRLILIYKLAQAKLGHIIISKTEVKSQPTIAFKIRQLFIDRSVEVATIQTSQIGLYMAGASMGLDSSSLQVFMSNRQDQLAARGLIKAFAVSEESINFEYKLPIVHPMHIGIQMNAAWEAWQRAEGGRSENQPSIRFVFDMDNINVNLCPQNLVVVKNIQQTLRDLQNATMSENIKKRLKESDKTDSAKSRRYNLRSHASLTSEFDVTTLEDHYYKDDLRSGAFQIVTGSQIPMAYQVTLNKNVISWRYPHPRAITKIVVFPLPDQDKEIDGILEFYSFVVKQWEQYVVFKLPVGEPREINLHSHPPELVFAPLWRFRAISEIPKPAAYQFNLCNFEPTGESTWLDDITPGDLSGTCKITAEQLSGILRVDSYFGTRQTPSTKCSVRFTRMDIYIHNSAPRMPKDSSCLEGYYLAKPLMSSHRVLTVSAHNWLLHYRCNSSAGSLLMFQTNLSSEIMDCSSSTMGCLADSFEFKLATSLPENMVNLARLRMCTSSIRLSLHLTRLRTLQALASDWQYASKEYLSACEPHEEMIGKGPTKTTHILEGRVSLWIRNSCSVPLRIGQEGTDEVFPLAPGAKFAYRWRNPAANKRLRFAVMSLTTEFRWSNCVTFAEGESRVRIAGEESNTASAPGVGLFVYVSVYQRGAHRIMRLSGRLLLANMLKLNLLYKVRSRGPDSSWSTAASGELGDERISRSVLSATNTEMVLKIKLQNHDTGWSGDIPIKECPKENVPWLVKVPSQGAVPYISVWCRVARARSDGRIVAVIWPLYVLTSNLTLDSDVLLSSELGGAIGAVGVKPPPIVQSAPGRGARTHLLAPGTTSAKHSLSFQYRNLECPVTREAVPLHYGVTDTSVFDKRVPVNTVQEVVLEIKEWLRSGRRKADQNWPNSIVSKHWRDQWQPALLQPRCDVTVRYKAIRAGGGGCSLEMQISPVLLMCNAAPVAVTLRAHDAAPLCKLEPGNIISPPTIVLNKPFFMSLEKGRETFVSQQLEVCFTDPGRYGAPPPGQVAVDHPADFAIPCRDKVALLNMHYEIKDEISIIGITPTFVLVNNLDIDLLTDTTVIPDMSAEKPVKIRPTNFKLLQPSKPGSVVYLPLCEFHLSERWRGGDVSELSPYLSLAAPADAAAFVPVKLGAPPFRRPVTFATTSSIIEAVAIVVTQHKHEGRWIVTLSPDPCPQFVVHNNTSYAVAIAQPEATGDDPAEVLGRVKQECAGLSWYYKLKPGALTRYSSPGYTFAQSLPSDKPPTIQWLSFAHYQAEGPVCWSAPVAATAGEQLVRLSQYSHALIMKLRVRPHPHSTLLELRDVTQTDISAIDIRKRLLNDSTTDAAASPDVVQDGEVNTIQRNEKFLKNKARELMLEIEIDMYQLERDLLKLKQQQVHSAGPKVEKDAALATGKKLTIAADTDVYFPVPFDTKSDVATTTGDEQNNEAYTAATDTSTPVPTLNDSEVDDIEHIDKTEIPLVKKTSDINSLGNKTASGNIEAYTASTDTSTPVPTLNDSKVDDIELIDKTEIPLVKKTSDINSLGNKTASGNIEAYTASTDTSTPVPTLNDSKVDDIELIDKTEIPLVKKTSDINSLGNKTASKENVLNWKKSSNTVLEKNNELLEPVKNVDDDYEMTNNKLEVNPLKDEEKIVQLQPVVTDAGTTTQEKTVAFRDADIYDLDTTTESTEEMPGTTTQEKTVAFRDADIYDLDSTTLLLREEMLEAESTSGLQPDNIAIALEGDSAMLLVEDKSFEWEESVQEEVDRFRCMVTGIVLEMAATSDVRPLLALHVDRTHVLISTLNHRVNTTITVTDIQIDNLQYESGQFDFAVIATTRAERSEPDIWPSIWNMFMEQSAFSSKEDNSRVVLKLSQDSWNVMSCRFSELTEIELHAGPLALYIEDAYVTALANLLKLVIPPGGDNDDAIALADARTLLTPLRLRLLHIHPVDVTLTLHTAVRMYIALDQSPLHLNAFRLQHMFTSTECLAHALTVHYLSAAILSAGWVVGGLELLGAPGALAARVGGATGGVRGVASTAAAALLRSLSACAGSLARNLDLLAGDEEHARRAAAARRRPPPTFLGGLLAGFTNFAINILGAVGGLAHHPLVGVAVGETESGAAALRRSLVGALTKPLSATADLVAYAGQGLLTQTGWDPVPQPRPPQAQIEESYKGWRRDCVRWGFRMYDLGAFAGFEVLLDNAPLQLIVTRRLLVFAEMECEQIVEMIELQNCTVGPFFGGVIELCILKNPNSKIDRTTIKDDGEIHISEVAMQRVARYTGAGGGGSAGGAGAGEERVLALLPAAGQAHALHATLLALTHANADTHFTLV